MSTTTATPAGTLTQGHKKVIFASSLGTVFEWYDFYLYGSLAAIIAKQFFSGLNDTSAFIFALLAFAAGFAVRARVQRHPGLTLGDAQDHGRTGRQGDGGAGRHGAGVLAGGGGLLKLQNLSVCHCILRVYPR